MSRGSKVKASDRKTRNDIILAVVLLVIAAASFLWWRSYRDEGAYVAVNINGVQTAVYPLSEDREVLITTGENNENSNLMVIEKGEVRVTEADCPDSICVKTRSASYVGESIVCLPHKLVIEIIGEKAEGDNGLDMTA